MAARPPRAPAGFWLHYLDGPDWPKGLRQWYLDKTREGYSVEIRVTQDHAGFGLPGPKRLQAVCTKDNHTRTFEWSGGTMFETEQTINTPFSDPALRYCRRCGRSNCECPTPSYCGKCGSTREGCFCGQPRPLRFMFWFFILVFELAMIALAMSGCTLAQHHDIMDGFGPLEPAWATTRSNDDV